MATETKVRHTAGPWSVRDSRYDSPSEKRVLRDVMIVGPGGRELASLYTNDGADEPEWFPVEANARAMAAAPDLLAALKAMVESYDGIRDALTCKTVIAKLAAADAAIQKAEGR